MQTLESMKQVLDYFFSISGQDVNESKSNLFFPKNTNIELIDEFEQFLNIKSTHDLGTYLGFPLTQNKPSKNKLSFLIDKVNAKLANWKSKCLTKARRMMLINSTLQAIPRYFMHSIHFPISIS